jgi:nicotinic acid phosphoribosyltransferase
MSDIANELRERSLRAEQEGEPMAMLDEAADELERLRLTDEEREALRKVLRRVREDYFAGRFADSVEVAAVIDGLLERTN